MPTRWPRGRRRRSAGGRGAFPSPRCRCCPSSKASTSSSSAAASRTSPPGSPAGARVRRGSIRRPRSCSRRAGARTRRGFGSRSSRVTASGCRFRTRRSISCSPSTAPRSGPTHICGSPRRRASCGRTAGWCSCATARCRSSACPTPGRSRTSCFVRSSGCTRFDWRSDNDGIAFGLSHGDWIRLLREHGFEIVKLVEIQAPAGAATHEIYDYVPVAWGRRWPSEDVWSARLR